MAKKNWIYMKCGLSRDPKHRAQMGECIWLFMHIIDRADWETGIAYDWKDREEAAVMGMSVETLRDQRQKLEKWDYIRGIQRQRGQDIKIMEWRNPRDYGAEIKNPRIQGDGSPPPSEFQGDAQGDAHVRSQPTTPTLHSKSKSDNVRKRTGAKNPPPPEVSLFREVTERFPPKVCFEDVARSIQTVQVRLGREVTREDLLNFYKAWCAKGYKPISLAWLEWAETGQIPPNGKFVPRKYELQQANVQALENLVYEE